MMRVAITGSRGFIGRALSDALGRRGDEVIGLSRPSASAGGANGGVEAAQWPPSEVAFPDVDAVIHLAGEPVAGRWTPSKKQAIRDSRVNGTRALLQSITQADRRPRAFICASAVGYYGDRGDETLTESAIPGADFLADVCVQWEHEAIHGEQLGMRVAMLRTGIVLGANGGALERMLPPFRLGLGGPMGSGRQWFPWVHLEDVVGMYLWLLDSEASGPINGVSPGIVRQTDFARALGKALGRPAVLPTPRLPLRLAYGEFADRLYDSQRVVPDAASRLGYTFQHTEIGPALSSIV